MRAFVAVEIPGDVRRRLGAAQRQLREQVAGMRWVRVESVHLTLLFLGEIPEGTAERIATEARGECAPLRRGRVRARGLGCFPARGAPRVIWAGVEEEGEEILLPLYRSLVQVAERVGLPPERRPFSPHLTLGRARGHCRREHVERALAGQADAEFGEIPVERCTLFRSILGPDGARHEPHASWVLGG